MVTNRAALHAEVDEVCAGWNVNLWLDLAQSPLELGNDVPLVSHGFFGFTMQPHFRFECSLAHRRDDLRIRHIGAPVLLRLTVLTYTPDGPRRT
jgi:hypothetical protein